MSQEHLSSDGTFGQQQKKKRMHRSIYLLSIVVFLFSFSFGTPPVHNSTAALKHLKNRGAKAARYFCDTKSLDLIDPSHSLQELASTLHHACPELDSREYPALLAFLKHRQTHLASPLPVQPIPKDSRCPVCAMSTTLYPNWAATMRLKGKRQYWFDGIKDMMRYYLDRARYRYDRREITQIIVQEYYSLQPLDAKKAWYVIGSDRYGPMGSELVPFSTLERAQTFARDHHGRTILRFDKITPHLLESLDPHTGAQ